MSAAIVVVDWKELGKLLSETSAFSITVIRARVMGCLDLPSTKRLLTHFLRGVATITGFDVCWNANYQLSRTMSLLLNYIYRLLYGCYHKISAVF